MIKVANQKIVNVLAFNSFKTNKLRNMIAVMAIALTTILFTTLFAIGMGMIKTMQNETMRQAGGSAHGSLKNLSQEEFDKIKVHPLIKDIGYNLFLSMADNKEFLKQHTEIWYSTEEAAKMNFNIPSSGRMPKGENELATDTATLDLLRVPHKLGEKVTLEYTLNGEKHTRDFILSGLYERDSAFPVGSILVSRSFIEKELADINQNYRADKDISGTIRADVMFRNSTNIEENIKTVIRESGYSINKEASNYIAHGVNWSYMSTNFEVSPTTVVSILLVTILIIFTGYLIIYNIFQISVIKDIRFYGLLKTIGTTSKQIKGIINKQALLLSVIGIPLGLAIGYFLGNILLPFVVKTSNFSGKTDISSSPAIFLGSAVFSLITIYISTRKPGKMASKVSPIEAAHYSGITLNSKKTSKKSTTGGKLCKMALSNLGRYKKRTLLVVISMSLSMILLNSVFTISKGFNMDKFLNKFVKTDFLIGHANYFNIIKGFHSEQDVLSQNFIKAVSSQKGFDNGGRIYYEFNRNTVKYKGNDEWLQLFGMEDFPLTQLYIVEGKFDLDKFKSGQYIIEGLKADDNGNIYWDQSHYAIGEKVSIKTMSGTFEYEVMAKCRMDYSNHVRFWGGFGLYLPSEEFCTIVPKPVVMSYQFNVNSNQITDFEAFIKDYTNKIEPAMDYESKALYESKFKDLQNMFLSVGGALSLIVGLIGILNFINSIVTSIISRRQEFAMLQSIGMTNRQLHKLLIYEGLYYALATIAASFLLGALFSLTVIKSVVGNLWFFSYKFMLTPLLISSPILLILSATIPFLVYHGVNIQSIVERLREAD
jgi:putative ABC transport system permease protein